MSTDNSYNAVLTGKSETSSVVDSSLNTQYNSEVKVIENRAENCEITDPIDNTVICQQTNEHISSSINTDQFINERVDKNEAKIGVSSTVDGHETTSDNNGINSSAGDTNGIKENNQDTEGNTVESSLAIEEKDSGNIRENVQPVTAGTALNEDNISKCDDLNTGASQKTRGSSSELDQSDSPPEKELEKKETHEIKSNPIENSEHNDRVNEEQKENGIDLDSSQKVDATGKSEQKHSTENHADTTEPPSSDTETRKDKLITDADGDKGSISSQKNGEDIDVNTDKTKEDSQPADNPTSTEQIEKVDLTSEAGKNIDNKTSDYFGGDNKEGNTKSNCPPPEVYNNDTSEINREDTTENNTDPLTTDDNELEIQRELERVYDNTVINDDKAGVRVSSAPESTHESDRGYSTELVIKTEVGENDDDYEDDFEDVEERDTKQPESTDEPQKSDESTGNNFSQLEQDIQEAKTNWENGVKEKQLETENKAETKDSSTKDTQEINCDSEIDSTVIVVEGEGIPKVYLSTVPDRPPSSEPDRDEQRNPQEEVENFKDDHANEVHVKNTEEEINQETLDEQSSKQPESVDTNDAPVDNVQTETNNEALDEQLNTSKQPESVDTENNMADKNEAEKSTNDAPDQSARNEAINGEDNTGVDTAGGGEERDDFYEDGPDERKPKHSKDSKSIGKQDSDLNGTSEDKLKNGKAENNGTNDAKTDQSVTSPEKESEQSKDLHRLEQITKKEESPLDQLLKRNVEIDGSVESIGELEHAVTSLLGSMKTVMTQYQERLKLQALRDFTVDMGKFRGDFNSVNDAYKRCSSMSSALNQQLKDLRHVTDDIRLQISRKFQNEDLNTWVDSTPEQEKEREKLEEMNYAADKAIAAKATEAKHAMATATIGVAEAQKFATEMEAQAIEAEAIATKAAAQAHAAIIAAEEARKAAEERARAEEASKKRAEERARVKAEEERMKKEQDDMKIIEQAAMKGSSVEDERKLFMEEKERKEAERRNPKNWPRYTYNVKAGDFDPGVGCIIRAIEGSMRKTDVTCTLVNQSTNVLELEDHEELVGNIITVKPTEEDMKFNFEEPFSIAIPVCNSRVPLGKESVIKQLTPSGKWKTLQTAEVQFEDLRELKFVEGRCRSFGTFVTILSTKKDTMQFTPKSFKAVSSVDSRITFSNKPGSFKHTVSATVEVQVIDVNAVSDLKVKVPLECDDLLTASPFINLSIPSKRFEKPIVVTMPLPQNQARQKRPTTGLPRENKQQDLRPATARPTSIKDDEEADAIHFLYFDDKNGWTKDTKCNLHQPKNKDVVSFEMMHPRSRFILLRTKPGIKDVRVEKIATLLEKSVSQKNVKLFLRQRHDDDFDIKVGCTASNKIHRALKSLEEDEGYTEGPPPSGDIVLQEGQELYLRFRGNIGCVTENPDLTLIYNSHIRACRQLFVEEIDKFAQKGLHNYRGFLQVLTKALIPGTVNPGTPAPKGPPEMVEAEILLCELLIELPKPEVEPPKPLKTAPLPIQDGPLTSGVLRYLAGYLGKEWKDLALHLNLKPMRIQAILRQNVNKDTPQTRFDMLMAWAKRIPKSVDKVQILCSALQAVGRTDLVEEVRYRGDEFRQKRQMSARASHLRQAFVKVAKTSAVFTHWQKFAKGLGVPDDDIKKIEGTGGSGQEKCYTILETWKNHKGDEASVTELASHLRSSKHEYLSREVESIMAV